MRAVAPAACSVAPGAPGASRVVYMCACVCVYLCLYHVRMCTVQVVVCDHVCVFMCVHVHNMSAYTYRANKGNWA